MKPAPIQATIDSASRTKPRAKAKTADRPMIAMTPISSGFIWQTSPRLLSGDAPHLAAALGRGEAVDKLAQMADRLGRNAVARTRLVPLRACARPRRDPGVAKAEFGGFLE